MELITNLMNVRRTEKKQFNTHAGYVQCLVSQDDI